MPTPNTIFSIAGSIALPCWAILALSLFVPQTRSWIWAVTGAVVPAAFAVAYIVLICTGFAEAPNGGFGSVTQVRNLFASDAALVAGWLHFLAFDLFIGTWIVRTGLTARLPRVLLLACLPLTFMLGPIGLLLFLGIRFAWQWVRAQKGDEA